MSRYRDGMRRLSQRRAEQVGGPWIATPGYIKGEIARLQTEMVSFDGDLIKSLSGSYRQWLSIQSDEMLREILKRYPGIKDLEDMKNRWGVLGGFPDGPLYNFYQFYNVTWIAVYRGWLAWYADHETFRDWYWGNVISSVESWRRQLVGCRGQVVQFENIALEDGTDSGMVITSPDPEKGDDWAGSDFLKGAGGLVKTLIIGGAVIIGGILGIKALSGAGSGRSYPSLPAASSAERVPRTKKEAQAERVAERIKEKS